MSAESSSVSGSCPDSSAPILRAPVSQAISRAVFPMLFLSSVSICPFSKIRFAVRKHCLSASSRYSMFSYASRLSFSEYHRSEKSAILSFVRLMSYAMSPADWQMT